MSNSVSTPDVLMRSILLPSITVNHRFPSGPAAMSTGPGRGGNSVKTPGKGDAANLVADEFGKRDVAMGASRDAVGVAVTRWDEVLANVPDRSPMLRGVRDLDLEVCWMARPGGG